MSKRIKAQDSRMRRPEQLEDGWPIAAHELRKNVHIHVRVYAVSRTSLLARILVITIHYYCGMIDVQEHGGERTHVRIDYEYT